MPMVDRIKIYHNSIVLWYIFVSNCLKMADLRDFLEVGGVSDCMSRCGADCPGGLD